MTCDALSPSWVIRFKQSPICFHHLARVVSTCSLSGGSPLFLYSESMLALDYGHLITCRRMLQRLLRVSLKGLTPPPSTVLISWAVFGFISKLTKTQWNVMDFYLQRYREPYSLPIQYKYDHRKKPAFMGTQSQPGSHWSWHLWKNKFWGVTGLQ